MKQYQSRKDKAFQPPVIQRSNPFQPRPFGPIPATQTPEGETSSALGPIPEASFLKVSIQDPNGPRRPPIQPKLTIGAPGDRYEQEADRVASQVVQQIHSPQANAPLQRDSLEEDELQMRPMPASVAGGPASESLESAISQARGRGQGLDPNLQQQMGQAMGADFSGVTIHADSQADQMNRSIQAKAFTTGQDIFFRQGAYQPGSRDGQELIAHELAHTVQQGAATVQRFPADIFTTPYAGWVMDNPAVSSPGEGAKGGVYFLRTGAGPVNSVAVKPLVDESPAQSQFGDQIIQTGFDIDTPNSRIVQKGTEEFQALFNIVKPHADNKKPPEKKDEEVRKLKEEDPNAYLEWFSARMGYVPIEETKAFKVMEKVDASSLSSIIKDSGDQQGVDKLLTVLRNNALLQKVGILAVADAVMGNDDRLSISGVKNMVNLGNYMISDNGNLFAIDTATHLRKMTDPKAIQLLKKNTAIGMELNILGEPNGALRLANLFLDTIQNEVSKLPAGPNFSPSNYYNNQVAGEVANVRVQIGAGIQSGLTKIKNILLGATQQDQQKQEQLRRGSEQTYGVEGRHDASFDTLAARVSYLESYTAERQGGKNATDAEKTGTASYSDSLMASTGNMAAINALKDVDPGALSLNVPEGFDKNAKSARVAVEKGKIEPDNIAKWVDKYGADLHVHALRVANAMQVKRGLIRSAVAIVGQLANDNSVLAKTQLNEYAKAYAVAEKQIINLRKAAGKIMLRLDNLNQKGQYTTFIGLLRQIQAVLQHTQQQFSQHI